MSNRVVNYSSYTNSSESFSFTTRIPCHGRSWRVTLCLSIIPVSFYNHLCGSHPLRFKIFHKSPNWVCILSIHLMLISLHCCGAIIHKLTLSKILDRKYWPLNIWGTFMLTWCIQVLLHDINWKHLIMNTDGLKINLMRLTKNNTKSFIVI